MDPVGSASDPADPSPEEGHRPTEINALLGRGTRFEGKLVFEGRVRIDGGFKGEIHGDDVLVIGDGAFVSGEVHVATCIVTGGEVEANIKARDGIELYAPARVTGALHAPAIFIDRGVRFEGTCKMAPLDDADAVLVPPVPDAPATPRAGTLPLPKEPADPGSDTGPER
jgi:cytoskeletal protein CcmA (bactofilin family)